MQVTYKTRIWFLVQEDPLEEETAYHSLQYSCLGNPMGRGTEQLSTRLHLSQDVCGPLLWMVDHHVILWEKE